MTGLSHTDASAASLLLTLEGAATAIMAWFVFRGALRSPGRRRHDLPSLWRACAGVDGAGELDRDRRAAIIGACVAWGLDNNLTRKVSLADPLQIVELKGLIAGPFNLLLGLWAGGSMPSIGPLLIAGIVGFAGYGLSLCAFRSGAPASGDGANGCLFLDRLPSWGH